MDATSASNSESAKPRRPWRLPRGLDGQLIAALARVVCRLVVKLMIGDESMIENNDRRHRVRTRMRRDRDVIEPVAQSRRRRALRSALDVSIVGNENKASARSRIIDMHNRPTDPLTEVMDVDERVFPLLDMTTTTTSREPATRKSRYEAPIVERLARCRRNWRIVERLAKTPATAALLHPELRVLAAKS